MSHIAYGTATQLVNVPEGATVEVWVEIMPRAIDVGSIRVRVAVLNPGLDDVGFYDRTRFGFGRFFDEMDLRSQTLSSALQEAGARLAGGAGLSSYPVFSRFGLRADAVDRPADDPVPRDGDRGDGEPRLDRGHGGLSAGRHSQSCTPSRTAARW